MAFPESASLLQFLLCNKPQQELTSVSCEHLLWMCELHRMPYPKNLNGGLDSSYSSHNTPLSDFKEKPLAVVLSTAAKLYKQPEPCEVLLSY